MTVAIIFLFVGPAFAGPTEGWIPDVKNGECWKHWRSSGISTPLFELGGREPYDAFYQRIERSQCWKRWLVIVYMAADNDLSPFGFRDLWEMESVGSTLSVDVVVFNDNAHRDGMRYLHIAKNPRPGDFFREINSRDEELAYLDQMGDRLTLSPDARPALPEGDSGSLETAGNFLRWAIQSYPAERILLVGWSHSEGFDAPLSVAPVPERPHLPVGKKGGFALDLNPNNGSDRATHMMVTEMAAGVRTILNELRGGTPIDIAGSDACLNQQLEFGYEWVDIARYVFGSSSIVQKKGFNYHTLLGWLRDHPKAPTRKTAAEIPKIYGRAVSARGADRTYSSYRDPFATMATWDTARMLYLHRAIEDIAEPLSAWIHETPDPTLRLLEFREDVIARAHRFGGISTDFYNLLQVMKAWAEARGLTRLVREISAADARLTDAVISSYIGEEYLKPGTSAAIPTSKGVAVWLPTTKDEALEMLPRLRQGRFYRHETDLGRTTLWASFVESLHSRD